MPPDKKTMRAPRTKRMSLNLLDLWGMTDLLRRY
jgi:hypothetical protein